MIARLRRGLAAPAVIALAMAALGAGCSAAPAGRSETLTVFAAASLAEAFGEAGRGFEARHGDLAVRFAFSGSQQLAMQLEQGAAADVFAAADVRWMDAVRERGLLAGPPVRFARNRLVVIVPRANRARIAALADLARPGVRVVIGAEAVPVGAYARRALGNLAGRPGFGVDYARAVLANVASEEENVKSVAGKIALDEADAGIVYRSDVTPELAPRVRVIEIPAEANVIAEYPIAVLRESRRPREARAFVDFVRSGAGRGILERHGFSPAGRDSA